LVAPAINARATPLDAAIVAATDHWLGEWTGAAKPFPESIVVRAETSENLDAVGAKIAAIRQSCLDYLRKGAATARAAALAAASQPDIIAERDLVGEISARGSPKPGGLSGLEALRRDDDAAVDRACMIATTERLASEFERRGIVIRDDDYCETDDESAGDWQDDHIRSLLTRGSIPDALLAMARRMPDIDRRFDETVERYFTREITRRLAREATKP
jgi:hypothetical protein